VNIKVQSEHLKGKVRSRYQTTNSENLHLLVVVCILDLVD
jgi:hypothetical protein